MRKLNFNLGVTIAIVVLLVFTYITFLGMLYKYNGEIKTAALAAGGVFVLVAACVYIMVNSKMTKNKEIGIIGQIIFGVIILSVFLVAGGPFTSFLKVVGSKQEIEKEIVNVKNIAFKFDNEYNNYVDERVENYQNSLPIGNDLKVQSMLRRLKPDSISVVQKQRQDWIKGIEGMSIWNIKLPQNLEYMRQCIADWTNNYNQLSYFSYDNQVLAPFEYKDLDTSIDNLMNSFKNAGYSIWALIVAFISALAMMTPYWLAIPIRTRKTKEIKYI